MIKNNFTEETHTSRKGIELLSHTQPQIWHSFGVNLGESKTQPEIAVPTNGMFPEKYMKIYENRRI
jgi:hypothetical protein